MAFTFEEALGEPSKFSFDEAKGEPEAQAEPEPVLAPPVLLSGEQQAIVDRDNPFAASNSWMANRDPEPGFGGMIKESIDEGIQAPLVAFNDKFPRASKFTEDLVENFTPAGMLNIPTKVENIVRGFAGAEPAQLPFAPEKPFFKIPEPTGDSALAGLGKLAARNINALQTPEMLTAAPLFANPLGRLLFAEQMGTHLPDTVGQSATALGENLNPTPSDYVTNIGQPLIEAGMTTLVAKGPRQASAIIDRTASKVTASAKPKTETAPAKTQTQAEVAAELGLTADAAGEGLWQFSVKTPEGRSVPFAVKEGAPKADITARAELVKNELSGPKPSLVAVEPPLEQLGKFKPSSGKVSWTPEYFKGAGENVFSPDWWVDAFDKIASPKYDGTGTSYQIGKFIRELGEEKGNRVIDALEQAREKMAAEIDLVRKDPKSATPEQMAKAMKFGTGAIQLPREAWEAALDSGSAKGELGGTPIIRKAQNEKAQTTQGQKVLAAPTTQQATALMSAKANAVPPTQPAGGAAPPVPPPVAPPGAAPAPAPGRGPATLKDVYSIFEPVPKPKVSLGQRVSNVAEAVRTGVSSKFRPIQKLAEDISASYGSAKKNVAGIFEQLKGSSGKGEADIYRFDKNVSKLVRGSEKDFSAYLFLRRGLDRLNQDVADVAAGLPARRKVSTYTPQDLQAKLQLLETQVGPEKLAKFQAAADKYQQHMDQALQLQVDSGRMSPAVYAEIKAGNQFYAPFKVMKYIEETSQPAGSGKRIDTLADFTKAMEGIESPDFKLGDMLGAARQNILLSRILAEKNRAMQNITQLAAIDTNSQFITKLKAGQDAPKGMEAVNVLEGGKEVRYSVNPDVAQAVQLYGENGGGVISSLLSKMSIPFRAGATALNLPFQVSNLLADVPRQALVSRYGTKGVSDLIRYPLDFLDSAFSNILGEMVGYRNKLMLDFLDSGVAGATIQEHLTPKALRTETVSLPKKFASGVLYSIPNFAKAIEQTSKTVGVKRAMRFEGVQSGAQLAKQIPEAVTEIRRFSGSPDFGRQGKWVEQARLNLLYMFLNARIQGTIADVGRLTGRDGAGTAAKTWAKILPAVGLPTLYAYLHNNSEENAEDYAKRPAQEKQNYWLIPKDTYITGANGEKIRDYWRIPKRESSKWIANMVESGMEFAQNRTPETFMKWAQGMMEDITPVNIQGDTAQERIESAAAGLNPLLKAPLELATGRDMYRHRDIIPDRQKKASPELQYTDRTAEVFKQAAAAMPDVAPEFMRSPLMLENMTKNLTAGLITQFLPRKPVEGRTEAENNPLLQRFQAVPYTDSTEFDDRMKALERESADEQITRFRTADKLVSSNKDKPIDAIVKQLITEHGPDQRLLERVVDLWVAEKRGITGQERRVLALPIQQRAAYIIDEIGRTPPELKQETLRNLALKRILTESVAQEMAKLKAQ